MDFWAEVHQNEQLETYVEKTGRTIPRFAMGGFDPTAPLKNGATETLLFALPPESTKDPVAGLMVTVGSDGRTGKAQLLIAEMHQEGDIVGNTPRFCTRFESPSAGDHSDEGTEGRHDFYHAQLSNQMRSSGSNSYSGNDLPQWFPSSDLAIPLPASDPLDLCLCAFLAVRHPRFLMKIAKVSGRLVAERAEKLLRTAP